jgi:hypothetical protein
MLCASMFVAVVGCEHMPWSKKDKDTHKSTTMKSDMKASTAAPAPAKHN